MSATIRRVKRVVAVAGSSGLLLGCGPSFDAAPAPKPAASIARAAIRAESAGSERVPQKHRGKLDTPAPSEPDGDDGDDDSPLGGGPHVAPPDHGKHHGTPHGKPPATPPDGTSL